MRRRRHARLVSVDSARSWVRPPDFPCAARVPHERGTLESVDRDAALDKIVTLLDAGGDTSVNTSMRLPSSLRDAASLAVEHLGLAASTTALTTAALRSAIETAVMAAALEAHYDLAPHARPTLAETALALAAQDSSPIAEHPELIEQAAAEVVAYRPNADADDVLLWATARRSAHA